MLIWTPDCISTGVVSIALVPFLNFDPLTAIAVATSETQKAETADSALPAPQTDAPFWNLMEAAIGDVLEGRNHRAEDEEKDSQPEQRAPAGDTALPAAWLHLFPTPASEPVLPYSLAGLGAPAEDTAEKGDGPDPVQIAPAATTPPQTDASVTREVPVRWRADAACSGIPELPAPVDARRESRPPQPEELSVEAARTSSPPGDLPVPEKDGSTDTLPQAPPPEEAPPVPSVEASRDTPRRVVERTVLAATVRIYREGAVERPGRTNEKLLQDHRPSVDLFEVSAKSHRPRITEDTVSGETTPETLARTSSPHSRPVLLMKEPAGTTSQEPPHQADRDTPRNSDPEKDLSARPEETGRPRLQRPETGTVPRTEERREEHRGGQAPVEAATHAHMARHSESTPQCPPPTGPSVLTDVRPRAESPFATQKAPATTFASTDGAAQVGLYTDEKPATGRAESIAIRVEGTDREAIEIRLQERRGEVHLSLRASASETVERIRENLPELSHRLQAEGFDAKTWRPDDLPPQTSASDSHQDPRQRDEQGQRQQPEHRRPAIDIEEDSETFAELFSGEGNQKWQ